MAAVGVNVPMGVAVAAILKIYFFASSPEPKGQLT